MSNSTVRLLSFISEGAAVERFHSRPMLKPITNGHHSHGVAMLCHVLTEGGASAELLMAALTHDLAEQAASDVSAPAKRALGIRESLSQFENDVLGQFGLRFEQELTPAEKHVLSIADQMEGMLSCCRERALGNKFVGLMFSKWVKWVSEENLNEWEREVAESILVLWQKAASGGPDFDVFQFMPKAKEVGCLKK